MEIATLRVYLYRVFWNWAGVLLAVDAVVALLERYFGESIQRRFNWKPHLPTSIKLGGAIVLLFIAQGLVYRDAQRDLAQAAKDNDGLHAALNALNSKLSSQEQQIKRLENRPPVVEAKTDPNVLRLLQIFQKELDEIPPSAKLSLKKRGLQFTTDLLNFLGERAKGEPPIGPEREKVNPEWERYMRETISLYYSRGFSIKAIQLIGEIKSQGIRVPNATEQFAAEPVNTFGIADVARFIGSTAHQMPK
jgi:hypothetical protein